MSKAPENRKKFLKRLVNGLTLREKALVCQVYDRVLYMTSLFHHCNLTKHEAKLQKLPVGTACDDCIFTAQAHATDAVDALETCGMRDWP